MGQTQRNQGLSLDNFWAYQAVVLADKISRHTLDIARKIGDVNLSQWRVLAAVGDCPGRTASEVVAVTPMDKGVVSRSVESLIELGLISKIRDENDKRRSSLSLTPQGQDIYFQISAEISQSIGEIANDALPPSDFTQYIKAYIRHLPVPD